MKDLEINGCKDLAMAIIEQAIADYKEAYPISKQCNRSGEIALSRVRSLERFFRSNYFTILNETRFSGKEIIKMLRDSCT